MQTKSKVVVNAVKLDPKTPLPLETNGRGYLTREGREYVPFLDNGDNLFQILLEAGLNSPTNLACVGSKTTFSIGRGWMLMDKKEDQELKGWSENVNKKGESLNDILEQIFNNIYFVGNVFVEIVRLKVGTSKYVKIYVKRVTDCRVASPEEDDIPEYCYISKQFRRKGVWTIGKEDEYTKLPIYTGAPDQEWYKDGKGVERCVFHLKNKMAGYDYYGFPSNIGCLKQQITESKIAQYNIDNFDNNMVIGGVVFLEGNMTDEESKKLAREITQAHTGDGKRGKYVVLSSEGGVVNSKIQPFDKAKDYDYVEGDKRVEDKIFLANNWSKALIDPQASGLGTSGKQIKELYETKMNTVIGPAQTFVFDKFLKPLMKICDDWMGKKWSAYEYGIDNIPVLGIGSELDVNALLTKDEGRKVIGWEEMKSGGDAIIKDSSKGVKITTE